MQFHYTYEQALVIHVQMDIMSVELSKLPESVSYLSD